MVTKRATTRQTVVKNPRMDAHELLLSPLAYMAPDRILDGLSDEQSAERVPGASHSIAEIVAHLV